MCGRYRLTRADRLAEKFDAELAEELTPRYNIAPTQPVPVVRANGSRRMIVSMRWGLIPNWAKDASMSQINARSETLLEKPAFKENFERRRCLIPANGFYEWKRSGKSKQPFHFGMKDDSIFAFAGIWDRWKASQGQVIESCAILTTGPNDLLRDVHDRMPVILKVEKYQEWLEAPASACGRLNHFLQPFDAAMMKRFAVSSAVNDPENDTSECTQEVPEFTSTQATLF
ncbi:MAG TPA: SOS response-associated peptidase [Terriglobales bacterium]|jgi:putative SOS response-associated peptidase YedK|nr:SOS response-associated peptidase [Terriglobales bacterium]